MDQKEIDQLIVSVQKSKKYRDLDIPVCLLRDLINAEDTKNRSKADVNFAFRKKLHNIVAPYLESIDYEKEIHSLRLLAESSPNLDSIKQWAVIVMQKHDSTRERIPLLMDFYRVINKHIGDVKSILDLACGLNPLSIPWFPDAQKIDYRVFDIHKPRINFLNEFFNLFYQNAKGFHQDILVQTPGESVDCVFFFKEAHRFEKRRGGSNRLFFERLHSPIIVVSLPAVDLSGHHSLEKLHTKLMLDSVQGYPWKVTRDQVGQELLFFIDKK